MNLQLKHSRLVGLRWGKLAAVTMVQKLCAACRSTLLVRAHEDEFVYLFEGTVILIEDGDETALHAGDCATFRKGT